MGARDQPQGSAKMGGEQSDINISGFKATTLTPPVGGHISVSIPLIEGLSPSPDVTTMYI